MMFRRVLSVLICWLLLGAGAASAKGRGGNPVPDVRAALAYFFQNHTAVPDDGVSYLVEKRPSGWIVRSVNYEHYRYYSGYSDTLWSAATGYRNIAAWQRLSRDRGPQQPNYEDILGGGAELYLYTYAPAYGYPGWEAETIDLLLPRRKDLDDTLLYVLGRAYAEQASNAYYQRNRIPVADTPGRKRVTDADRRLQFLSSEKNALDVFLELKNRNPEFETEVGRISTKIGNEYQYAYTVLRSFSQDSLVAQQFVKTGLYDPFLVRTAKKVLDACPVGSVLLADGDNDYWPLLYVQAQAAYRRDVRLVSLGLLSMPAYIDYLQKPLFGKDALPMTLPGKFYDSAKLVRIGLQHSMGDDSVRISDFLANVRQQKYKSEEYGFPVTGAHYFILTDKAGNRAGNWMAKRSFLTVGDIALLDLLQRNNGARGIYYANTRKDNIPAFGKAFVNEGLLQRFVEDADDLFSPDRINATAVSLVQLPKPQQWPEHRHITDQVLDVLYFMIINENAQTNFRAEQISVIASKLFTDWYFATPDQRLYELANYCYRHKRRQLADNLIEQGITYCDYYSEHPSFLPATEIDPAATQREIGARLQLAKEELAILRDANK